jgi:hypothetical protein
MVVALGELTPSNLRLSEDAVLGTVISTLLVVCPLATVMTCGVVRLPPLLVLPPPVGGAGAGAAGVVLVVEFEPPPQPIQQRTRNSAGKYRIRIAVEGEPQLSSIKMRRFWAVLHLRGGC